MTRSRSICVFFAAVIFLRAFVPVGYMLQLGGANDMTALALVFCPTQNSTLDLSLFQSLAGVAHHHHGHSSSSSSDEDTPNDGILIESSPDCSIWIGSTAIAITVEISNSLHLVSISLDGRIGNSSFRPAARANPSPIRAPPSNV